MMKKTQPYLLRLLIVVLLLAACSLSLVPRLTSNATSAGPCTDPIGRCRRAVYIGSNGSCSCFTCADSSVACTDKDKDKLELFEEEAKYRNTTEMFQKLPASEKIRLMNIGIKPYGYANTNSPEDETQKEKRTSTNRNSNTNANSNSSRNLNFNRPPNVNQKPSPEP